MRRSGGSLAAWLALESVLVEFRRTYPALPVVVVSASDRHSDVIKAIDLGAMGFVPKRASNDTLVDALVHANGMARGVATVSRPVRCPGRFAAGSPVGSAIRRPGPGGR